MQAAFADMDKKVCMMWSRCMWDVSSTRETWGACRSNEIWYSITCCMLITHNSFFLFRRLSD